MANGSIAGAETELAFVGNLPRPGTITANITFYPKVNAVVVNQKVFRGLSDEQRGVLRTAAANTLRAAVAHPTSEAEGAAVYCRNGGAIAVASDAELAAVERAAQPVYHALERDRLTNELIGEIRRMKERSGTAAEPPERCRSTSSAAPPTSPQDTLPSTFPEGVYRAELRAEELIESGMDPVTAHDLAGIRTLTFENGRWRDHTEGIDEDCVGLYSVRAGFVSLRQDRRECGEAAGTLVMTARWSLDGDQLRFVDVRWGRPLEWGSKPWTKIG